MITRSMISAISRTINDDDIDFDSIIIEGIFGDTSASEWESKSELDMEMDELTIDQFKTPSKGDPSINRQGTLLLPTFVSDYELKFIINGIWNILQRKKSVIVSGHPGFAYQGDTAPFVGKTNNVDIDRAIERYLDMGAMVISKVDDYTLSDLSRMDLPGPMPDSGPDNDWLRQIKETISELEEQKLVKVEKFPAIPRKFGNYWAIIPIIRDNAIMLFSRKYGEGFYIIGRKIDGMDWDVAIQRFYRDPFSYLEKIGIDPDEMGASRRSRIRLLFRDYIRATKQGIYVDRSRADDIYDFANGEQIRGVPEGIFEHILRPTRFI